jgi:hypothetical protein
MRGVADTKPLVRGALAGLIATVPMTVFMLACHKRLPVYQRYPLPPSLITQRAFGHYALPWPGPMPNPLSTLAAHFAFGAVTGALFALAPAALRRQYPAAAGIGYGLAVWAGSYLGWVPGLRLMPPATRQPASRNAMMIAAHIVWGTALGLALEALRSRPSENRTEAETAGCGIGRWPPDGRARPGFS